MIETGGTPATPRRGWMRVSWKRVVIALASIVIVIGAIVWFLAPWYWAMSMRAMSPELQIVPVDVPDKSITKLSPVHATPPGYTFQVPWDDVVANKDTQSGSSVRFKSGYVVLAMKPASDSGFASAFRKLPDGKRQALIRVFSEEEVRSDYQLLADTLQTTPDQIRWWARTHNVKVSIFFGLKFTEISNSKAVFRVGNSDLRGFEFVDSVTAPRMVKLKLFDKTDQLYEILVARTETGPPMPQADINAIIASLRPISHR
jgi:hypothetical protein